MKVLFKTSIFLFIVLVISSCSDKVKDETSDFTIKYGSECGWCGGQEYITVTISSIEYERNIPCGENEGISRKGKNLTKNEWAEITDSFDYSLFKILEYNECNVCVDGCDEIIRIIENGVSHELLYTSSN
jgi:hypothetical protein